MRKREKMKKQKLEELQRSINQMLRIMRQKEEKAKSKRRDCAC